MRPLVLLLISAGLAQAAGTLTVSTPGYAADRSAEYTISHVYLDEIAGTTVPITFRFSPGVGDVIDVELWTNANRRDLANSDKNGDSYPDGVVPVDGNTVTDSAADTDPVTGHYFAPLNMNNLGGGTWELTVPVAKTGAYRASARFRTTSNPGTWQWYGLRDHCVVAAPVIARDVRLYEINVFNIEANGDTFATRSTLEDLHNAAGAPHNGSNRWDLDYLKNLGCNWLWFQPIHPNGIDGREVFMGSPYDPGSPYAVKNFFEVNELMTKDYNGGNSLVQNRAAAMAAWQNFVAAADAKEVGIMLDAPFNHTAFDVELAQKGVDLFQRQGETWSPLDQIRNREARFFSRDYNPAVLGIAKEDLFVDGGENYGDRATSGSDIAPGPDRFDFGKWLDVKDVYFGRYDALVEYNDTWSGPEVNSRNNEGDWFAYDDAEWNSADFTQDGQQWNVTRRVWQYFAHYAVHWLEKTRPVGQNRNSLPADGNSPARYAWDARGIDGLRCDFGQGLPPQCWEYIINVARSKKWSFVMMTESLDGGNVTYRSARQFDILNESIVFPLKEATRNRKANPFDENEKDGYREIFDDRRISYGQALVLTNNTSHDEEVMADPWQAVVRYLACASLGGVPLIFPGQELGISTTFGYQHYETNFGKQIPHFKRWNSMTPVWNNSDYGNDHLYPVYAAANRARAASPALRASNRWFLYGNGNNPQIQGVAKYQSANASPAFSDVMLAFSNLSRDEVEADQFVIPGELAPLLGIQDGRTYNTRNLAAYTARDANRDDVWLWGAGITGANLKSGGFFVSLNKVPDSQAAWSAAPFEGQYLKLYDVTPPPSPAPLANYYEIGSSGTFTWVSNAGPDDNVTSWLVEVFDGDGDPVAAATVAAAQYTFNGTPGETYRARITAISVAGIASSAPGQSDAGAPNPGSTTTAVQLLSAAGDQDGDGESNADEQAAGTNPLSAASVFRVTGVLRNGGSVEVSFSSVAGLTYQLETSTTLLDGSWSDTGVPLEAVGASSMISAPVDGGRRFYRVRVKEGE
jgi:glycosidase